MRPTNQAGTDFFSIKDLSQADQLLLKKSCDDSLGIVKLWVDMIYRDPFSLFPSIASSCAAMLDGPGLFADIENFMV